MTPTERFAHLVAGPESELRLDEAALLIAAHAHPHLDPAAELARLDELARGLPAGDLAALLQRLFAEAGFRGNEADYYDPENSYLDTVLERRTGIPITLSVVTLEVARRSGTELVGIGMPGHFLVGTTEATPRYLDPFNAGCSLDAAGCAARFAAISGGQRLDPAALRPVGPRAILARMLANLTGIARRRHDVGLLQWVLELRAAVPDQSLAERRDLAAGLAGAGRFDEAAEVLERLAVDLPTAAAEEARRAALTLRARLN
ncbi:MAG: transglutaminase family protein [Acidimicrobiia bacterium]